MPHLTSAVRSSILSLFDTLREDSHVCDDMHLQGSVRLGNEKVRVPSPVPALRLGFGNDNDASYWLQLASEIVVDASGSFNRGEDYLLLDPEQYFAGISGFLRLSCGETLVLGRNDPLQQALLRYPEFVGAQHLRLKLKPEGLVVQRESLAHTTLVAPLDDQDQMERRIEWRRSKIESLARVLATPIELLPCGDALNLLERVLAVLEHEPCRLPMRDGHPGAVLEFPDRATPIFVGDLHARIDNLLVVLTQNGFLESLQNGSGVLILLGDAVHPEVSGQEDQMDTSMVLMDLILRLKLLFPRQVFYLRGNHDSFSDTISKGGVPQGLVWEKALLDHRGPRYRDAMQRFYDLLPYIAVSPNFLACHAGAPTIKTSRDDLIHVREYPKLEHQLAHGRIRKGNTHGGYGSGDVKRLRKHFGLDPDTPFIVGHTPLSTDATYWLNPGGIHHHHILFSAATTSVGVITQPGRRLMPLRYPVEPLLPLYNRLLNKSTPQE